MTPAPYAPMAQAPMAQPAYTVPPYVSAPPAAKKSPVALYVGGAVVLVALAVGATAMILKPGEAPVVPPVAVAPPPVAQPVAVAAAPTPTPTPAPVEAPPPAAPVAEVQPDAGTLVAAAMPAEPEKKTEPAPKEEDEEELTASRTRTRNTRVASASTTSTARTTRRTDPEPVDTTPPPPVKSGSSDPFDDIFGDSGSKSGPTPVAKGPAKTTSTYVPPAPGGGNSAPAELAQSDIMQVVLGKRSAIVACATQAKASDPALAKGGRFVMSWNIQTSGRTTNVKTKTADIKGSKLDSCVSDIVKSMRFPAHRKSGGQDVDFPFTY